MNSVFAEAFLLRNNVTKKSLALLVHTQNVIHGFHILEMTYSYPTNARLLATSMYFLEDSVMDFVACR